MALPSSGSISLSQVNVELGRSATAQISLGESAVRTLFGKPSGAISMSDGYGKANQFSFTISSNQTNANLRTLAVNAGWNQTSKVVCTINSGIYISSNSTGTPALTINGSFPNGVEVTNNGNIIGMGGAGGTGRGLNSSGPVAGSAGGGGGLALSVASAVQLRNNGTIGGGGGGGGGGGAQAGFGNYGERNVGCGGGGGGGGRTGTTNSAAGAGGNVTGFSPIQLPGLAGGAGTSTSAGGGGAGRNSGAGPVSGAGGGGGGWGATGSAGVNGSGGYNGGSGTSYNAYGGGSAGAAVSGNSNITWLATGTRLGAIS